MMKTLPSITEVLGPGWIQDIDFKKRLVMLTHEQSKLRVSLKFDRSWVSFEMNHDYPKNRKVNVNYMNDLEYFYYGLYIITSSQRPFREWIEEVVECLEDEE
jgi:hypothetical protein